MEPVLLHEFLSRSADRDPSAPLLLQGNARVSYGELATDAHRVARLLLEEGVRRGDRVGVLDDNGPFYVAAYYGALEAGAIAVPLNTHLDPHSLRTQLVDCEARALAAGTRFAELARRSIEGAPSVELLLSPAPIEAKVRVRTRLDWSSLDGGSAPKVPLLDLDRASIVYTSGSTGKPKGATLSHLNLVANTRSIVRYLGLTAADRMLVVLPFFYVYGKSLLNTHVAAGGSLVLENRFLFPQLAVDAMEREEATGFAGVPSTFAILLDRTNVARKRLPALRYLTQAGGAMAPATIRRVLDTFPGTKLWVMYGATEAGARLTYLPPEDLPRKIGSIGVAIPNVEMRVLRKDGTEAAPNEEGELVARGSNIMEGYWNDPEETARVLDGNGYHTGDLGRRDEDGYFWVLGRTREMIKSGAHRISPKEIEEAILEHPDVSEAAVIGVGDALLGEAIRAYVVPRAGAAVSGEQIGTFLKDRLAAYKIPGRFVTLEALPKSAAGKIRKDRLREQAAEERT